MPQMEGSRKRGTALLCPNLVSLNVETDKPMNLFPPSMSRSCLPMGRAWPVPLATAPHSAFSQVPWNGVCRPEWAGSFSSFSQAQL